MLTKVKTTSKKAFSVLLTFVMCFTAFAICMPVIADAIVTDEFVPNRYYSYPDGTEFVSEIIVDAVGYKDNNNIKDNLTNNGYKYLDYDLNLGQDDADYIYLGYKTSKDINNAAATYILAKHEMESGKNPATYDVKINGKTITLTGIRDKLRGNSVYDINENAPRADWIYLYYSNDPSLGLPITAFAANDSTKYNNYFTVVKDDGSKTGSFKASDLNGSNDNSQRGGKNNDDPLIYLHYGNYNVYTEVTYEMQELLYWIDNAGTLGDQNCYTASSWRTFSDALNAANRIKDLFNNPYRAGTATADQIVSAINALENAINGLETVIRINANGGTATATQYIVNSGAKTTILFPASKYTATKEGHSFIGWNTDPTSSKGSTSTLTVPVGGTVYAIFSVKTFTVNFKNSLTGSTITQETVNYNENATAPEVPQTIKNDANTHYRFKGWDKNFTNVTESLTVSTIYELEEHSLEVISETEATCNQEGVKVYACSACDYTKTETSPKVPGNHVNKTEYPEKESTCNVAGYTAYIYCNDCHKIVSGKETLPLKDHTWGDWSKSTATCTQAGTSKRTCTVCNATETKSDPATGHTWGDWEVTKKPTCTAEGREYRQCSICKETETKIAPATGHSYKAVVTNPTCTQKGFTTHTCSVCGDSYIDTYVDALDHNWVDVGTPTIAATCTASGKQNQECSRCHITQVATVDALGHDWKNQDIAKHPTCIEIGIMSATCGRCGEHKDNIEIPALGHDWNEGVITTQPTCTSEGNLLKTCNTCHESMNITINALGHDWDEGTVTKQPTCTSEGSKYFECGRCDLSKTEVLPALAHNYKGVVTFPTCTEGGYTTYTCSDCGKVTVSDYTDALGHADIVTVVPPTCTQQGYTATRCLVCNRITRTDYVPATGHNYEKITVAPTCTQQGYTLSQCTSCYDSTKSNFVAALGHEYTVSTVAPTCTQQGYDLHDCIRCDNTKKNNYTEATGHNHLEEDRIEPTKTHNGYILYVCDICANEKKEILYYGGKDLVCITLLDTNGNPVADATVSIYSITTGKYYTITTDKNGYFTELLEEGDYEIVIRKTGYKETRGYIFINNNDQYVEIPAIPTIDECDCFCHKTDFISAIRRIIAKILAIFGTKHDCCEYSEV